MTKPKIIRNSLIYLCLVGITAVTGCGMLTQEEYEAAKYTIIRDAGDFEIRRYDDIYVASAEMKNGRTGSFLKLFGYISKKNSSDTEIAMTVPVFGDMENDNARMFFVLPGEYQNGEQEIPTPTNPDIKIEKITGGQFAVYKYTGRDDSAARAEALEKLRQWADADGMILSGDFLWATYSRPSIFRPNRQNDVLARIADQE